jgi:hypothetical protein
MRWAGHVASIGEMRNAYDFFLSENRRGRDHAEDLGVDGILGKYGGREWTGCICVRMETSGGFLCAL